MKIVIKTPKRRMHKMLFDDDLPFFPKVEKPKKRYVRRDKHRVDYFKQEA